jgi:hypothetical protein
MQRLLISIQRRGFPLFCAIALLACATCCVVRSRHPQSDLLHADNRLGESAQTLLHLSDEPQPRPSKHHFTDAPAHPAPVFRWNSDRMPVGPVTIAGLYLLFHTAYLPATLLKTFLFLVPVLLAFYLAWTSATLRGPWASVATLAAFSVAILLPPTLNNAVSVNFEEAFSYGWLALAFAVLLFPESLQPRLRLWTLVMAATLSLTYLSKSSMLVFFTFAALLFSYRLARTLHRPGLAASFLIACACIPLLWGIRQHAAGGRFSVGTSLDGFNLYKGNNPSFLDHYPPPAGHSLDDFDGTLTSGQNIPSTEWAMSQFGTHAALAYMRSNPAATLRADWRKAEMFFLRVHRDHSAETYSPLLERSYTAGMVIFRVMLLSAILLSIFQLFRGRGAERAAAAIFLAGVIAIALPYIIGFALTRQATVLLLPAAAYLSRSVRQARPSLSLHGARSSTPLPRTA